MTDYLAKLFYVTIYTNHQKFEMLSTVRAIEQSFLKIYFAEFLGLILLELNGVDILKDPISSIPIS